MRDFILYKKDNLVTMNEVHEKIMMSDITENNT